MLYERFVQEVQAVVDVERSAEADVLRALAQVSKRYIFVFDLEHQPSTCFMYPLLPQDSFRVLSQKQPSKAKAPIIHDRAWSIVLGKDTLPTSLLTPKFYSTNDMLVISKHANQFSAHIYTPERPITLSEGLQAELGLHFDDFTFEAGPKRPRTGVPHHPHMSVHA